MANRELVRSDCEDVLTYLAELWTCPLDRPALAALPEGAGIADFAHALGWRCTSRPLTYHELADAASSLVVRLDTGRMWRPAVVHAFDADSGMVMLRLPGEAGTRDMHVLSLMSNAAAEAWRLAPTAAAVSAVSTGSPWVDPVPFNWLRALVDRCWQSRSGGLLWGAAALAVVVVLALVALLLGSSGMMDFGTLMWLTLCGGSVVLVRAAREQWQAQTKRACREAMADDVERRLRWLAPDAADSRSPRYRLQAGQAQALIDCMPDAAVRLAAGFALEAPMLALLPLVMLLAHGPSGAAAWVIAAAGIAMIFCVAWLLGGRAGAASDAGAGDGHAYVLVPGGQPSGAMDAGLPEASQVWWRRRREADAQEARDRRVSLAEHGIIWGVAIGVVLATTGIGALAPVAAVQAALAAGTVAAASALRRRIAVVRAIDRDSGPLRAWLATAEPAPSVAAGSIDESCGAEIVFDNVAFRHDGSCRTVFDGMSFRVPTGGVTAIVGPSGSGKSTLLRMMQGALRPVTGRVRIDGWDAHRCPVGTGRPWFGVVAHDSAWLDDTLLANLVAAEPRANMDNVVAACNAAMVHEAISALPDGYHTVLGPGGAPLSAGQRQQLAIARALLRQPRILLLDEPFGVLDQASAEGVMRVLQCLRGEVTVVLATHQLPRGLSVDSVVMIEDGGCSRVLEVVER